MLSNTSCWPTYALAWCSVCCWAGLCVVCVSAGATWWPPDLRGLTVTPDGSIENYVCLAFVIVWGIQFIVAFIMGKLSDMLR